MKPKLRGGDENIDRNIWIEKCGVKIYYDGTYEFDENLRFQQECKDARVKYETTLNPPSFNPFKEKKKVPV